MSAELRPMVSPGVGAFVNPGDRTESWWRFIWSQT
jgi:hypothetical protein